MARGRQPGTVPRTSSSAAFVEHATHAVVYLAFCSFRTAFTRGHSHSAPSCAQIKQNQQTCKLPFCASRGVGPSVRSFVSFHSCPRDQCAARVRQHKKSASTPSPACEGWNGGHRRCGMRRQRPWKRQPTTKARTSMRCCASTRRNAGRWQPWRRSACVEGCCTRRALTPDARILIFHGPLDPKGALDPKPCTINILLISDP